MIAGVHHGLVTIQVNGVELDYLEHGTGIPVVFSHGSSSDIRYWESQREAFAARYRFVAYSRRFHGTGRWPAESDPSTDAHVADLVEIMRRLEAGPVHLVGFSTAIALRAALREPGLVRSLTVVEPNVPWLLEGDREGEAVAAWWRDENERVRAESGGDEQRSAVLWFELVDNCGPGTFGAQPETIRRMWLENFGARRPPVAARGSLTCIDLAAITVPTLAVGAEHGLPYSRIILARLAACIPQSRLLVIPFVTHFMSCQAPDVFNAAVLAFLQEVDSAGGPGSPSSPAGGPSAELHTTSTQPIMTPRGSPPSD